MSRRIKRALLSVFDKTGIIDFAKGLSEAGVEIVSTGGTARALAEAGVKTREISDLTGFPEMLDGRVKTLHPRVHGGLLAVRDNPGHMSQAEEHRIEMIDLVAINLYPFERTVEENPDDRARIIEMIDIGGPAMLRSASKNHRYVTVVVDPADYPRVLEQVRAGGVPDAMRLELAARAFGRTAGYDAAIAATMERFRGETAGFPDRLVLSYHKVADLRYGENPHQSAALYADPRETGSSVVTAEQLQGKELSFNNILDLDAAWGLAGDFDTPACAIIKHNNPAGAALAPTLEEAYRLALACDPLSAFGGIVAFNRTVTGGAAREMSSLFLEAVIAPDYDPEALEVLRAKKNLRVMRTGTPESAQVGRDYKRVAGGLLAQDRDRSAIDRSSLKIVTRRPPTREEMDSLLFAWRVARHVKSNAIVYAKGTATIGVGAGQMSRVDAVRLGAMKAAVPLEGSVLASDAFFPFRDNIDEAARAGVRAIIEPGGSVRDAEVIQAADEHDIAMVFTGRRHFRH